LDHSAVDYGVGAFDEGEVDEKVVYVSLEGVVDCQALDQHTFVLDHVGKGPNAVISGNRIIGEIEI
jgi:hypothetical protein